MLYRSDPWNGVRFNGIPAPTRTPLLNLNFVNNNFFFLPRNSTIARYVINQTVYTLQRFIWDEPSQNWKMNLNIPRDDCDRYNHCGSYGYCDMVDESPVCECLRGFEPTSHKNWVAKNWTQGCVLSSKRLRCRDKNKDGFELFTNMKFPDTRTSWMNTEV